MSYLDANYFHMQKCLYYGPEEPTGKFDMQTKKQHHQMSKQVFVFHLLKVYRMILNI